MASEVDWASMGGSNDSGKSGIKFVKFVAGQSKKLRPIGKAVRFYKFFVRNAQGARSVVVDPEFKKDAAAKLSAHAGQEIKPTLRYAINVIDREDNEIKVLESGQSVFEHFANWSQGNGGSAPGGTNGWDWNIAASGEGLNRKYTTTPLRPAVLTQDEIHRIRELKEIYSLKEVFKGCSVDDVVERAFGERSNDGPEPQAAPEMSTVPSDDPANW